jgi:hypothetical protein
MKKRIVRIFCMLILCSLLLITVGATMAAEPGYERRSYPTQVIPTIDGMWTSDDEWTDGEETWIGTDVVFRSTWDGDMTRWIVEFLTDTTNDTGDYLQFCFDPGQYEDSELTLGHNFMLEITGHTELGRFNVDEGDWVYWEGSAIIVDWANSLSASPTNSTPHWIYELQLDKSLSTMPWSYVWNFLLGVNDASNPGFHAWPPTDPVVPDGWGIENYSTEPIPEGLTFAVMALLTTVAMLVGYKYFAKRKEIKAH